MSLSQLQALLRRRAGSEEGAQAAISEVRTQLGLRSLAEIEDTAAAVALCSLGERPEAVSKLLSWREFEIFVSHLMAVWGYQVRWNVHLKRPRAQVDLVASGPSMVLSVDCKHWKRGLSPSALRTFAKAQIQRSELLRKQSTDPRPIASAILAFADAPGSFVDGVAFVPICALRDFLAGIESYGSSLELR